MEMHPLHKAYVGIVPDGVRTRVPDSRHPLHKIFLGINPEGSAFAAPGAGTPQAANGAATWSGGAFRATALVAATAVVAGLVGKLAGRV